MIKACFGSPEDMTYQVGLPPLSGLQVDRPSFQLGVVMDQPVNYNYIAHASLCIMMYTHTELSMDMATQGEHWLLKIQQKDYS